MMYSKQLKVILIMVVIQVLNTTKDVLGYSQSVNETGLLHTLGKLKGYEIQIPKECEMRRFCENVPNYPEEIMVEIIKKLEVYDMFTKLNMLSLAVHRKGNGVCLCHSEVKRFVPLAVADETGKWVLVLNSKVNPVQSFVGESCNDDQNESRCTTAKFQPGHHGQCMETFVRRKILVINDQMDQIMEQSQPLPGCCVCRDVLNKHYFF